MTKDDETCPNAHGVPEVSGARDRLSPTADGPAGFTPATAARRGGDVTIPETERELFSYLCSLTRDVRHSDLESFTTTGLSRALSISRNLASHYLNDLVRARAVVKAGARPVYYFSRRDLERVIQAPLERSSYESVGELVASRTQGEPRDFERAIGHDLSLASVVEKLKAAVTYPPHGLPVLVSGATGTGKSLLVRLMAEYGRRVGALGSHSGVVMVDCARYARDHEAFIHAWVGSESSDPSRGTDAAAGEKNGSSGTPSEGWPAQSHGGIVALRDVDLLSPATQEFLVAQMVSGRERAAHGEAVVRIALLTTRPVGDPDLSVVARAVPVTIRVPLLSERSSEEREELVLSFFKEEGRRLGADVFVSRAAFSCLVEASFEDNVRGIRSCVTSCCASAYLDHEAGRLEVQAFLLPGSVLESLSAPYGSPGSGEEDSGLIDTTRAVGCPTDTRSVRAFAAMLEAYRSYLAGTVSLGSLEREVMGQVRDYEDYLAFDAEAPSRRAAAYERVVADVAEGVRSAYGVDLSKKAARVIARCAHAQSHPGTRLSRWRSENQPELQGLLALLRDGSDFARLVSERVAEQVEGSLGLKLDVLTLIFVFAIVREADRRGSRRQAVGIVLAHGYSTATSIADAANRILRSRVFEAIDMSYDQQVSDVMAPLRNLLETYAFCRQIVLLVDMGSLEHVLEELGEISNVTLGVFNNASTGVALEIGAGLLAGEPLSGLLPAAAKACANRYQIVEARVREQALVFCSEGGSDAAERIKSLVERSLETTCPLRLLASSPQQLRREGVCERYDVLAVIGTDDPALPGIEFIALEELIAGERDAAVDKLFSRFLSQAELERFHQNLVKNLTLRNVIESVTILNPEKVLEEVEAAVERLQALSGERMGAHTLIGFCVHLCCLIERLVTRNPIESYLDVESFEAHHAEFIDLFRQSFDDISRHYHVEVPVAEIAYAFDYVHQKSR